MLSQAVLCVASLFLIEPIKYKKGETRTQELIPTGDIIGEGWGSKVALFAKDPERYVVKKSIWPLENEYWIGRSLNHKNIVKPRGLFIKEIPLTDERIAKLMSDKKWSRERSYDSLIKDQALGKPLCLYKMVMDRVFGKTLDTYFGGNLDSSIVKSLLTEAKDSCLYLFDQKIKLQAIHGENAMICNRSHELMIIDLGHWKVDEDPASRGFDLLRGVQRLMFNIISTSSLYHVGRDSNLTQFNSSVPNLCKQDAIPSKATQDVVFTHLTDNDFRGKSELEIRVMLEEYCDGVLKLFLLYSGQKN